MSCSSSKIYKTVLNINRIYQSTWQKNYLRTHLLLKVCSFISLPRKFVLCTDDVTTDLQISQGKIFVLFIEFLGTYSLMASKSENTQIMFLNMKKLLLVYLRSQDCALGELRILVYCFPIVLSSWKYKPTLKASKKILSKLQSGSAINVLYRLGFPTYFGLQLFYTHLKVMRRRLKR